MIKREGGTAKEGEEESENQSEIATVPSKNHSKPTFVFHKWKTVFACRKIRDGMKEKDWCKPFRSMGGTKSE